MKKFITFFLVLILSFSFVGCSNVSERACDINYNLFLTLNEDMTVDGSMSVSYINFNSSMENLKFCLYPNAYRKDTKVEPISYDNSKTAYPNGKSYGDIEILSVKSQNKDLFYKITGENENILQVDKSVEKFKEVIVEIEFKVTLANVLHRLGYGKNTVNLCNFYPIICVVENGEYVECVYEPFGDPFYSENANYKVELSLPSTYSVASSLKCEGVEIVDNLTTYKYEQNSVKDIAFILSTEFEILKDKVGNTAVYYYYFNDQSPEKTLNVIKESLTFFGNEYTTYPYQNYTVCQSDFIYGGMEYPCLVYVDEKLKSNDLFYTVVHETAHQWWYGLVGVNELIDAYIDEGLTEFSTVNFFNKYDGYGIKKDLFINNTKKAYDVILSSLIEMGVNARHGLRYPLKDFSCDAEYVATAYYKSALTFFEIEEKVGAKKFNKFLKGIISKYAYKNINTKTLDKEIKKLSKDAHGIFSKNVYGE